MDKYDLKKRRFNVDEWVPVDVEPGLTRIPFHKAHARALVAVSPEYFYNHATIKSSMIPGGNVLQSVILTKDDKLVLPRLLCIEYVHVHMTTLIPMNLDRKI
jgi:hypothetical protein